MPTKARTRRPATDADGPGGRSYDGGMGEIVFTSSSMYINPFMGDCTKPFHSNMLRSAQGT
jgi:hypothetical protein